MAQNCDRNDYSLLTAKTGIAAVSTGNPNLNGTGTLKTVLTAGENGATVKSIIIKALQPTKTGMIRLFVGKDNPSTDISLIREIPIPTYPMTASTPTPAPIWPMLEIDLVEEFKLKPNYILYASTQNSEKFNVIAEAVLWEYPDPVPDTCCNFMQETANTGIGTISTGTNKLDGDNSVTIFTAGTDNGSIIKAITISALQSTNPGMVRLFVGPDTGSLNLWMEVVIPQSNQSAFQPSFKVILEEDYYLQEGFVINASTELSESFAITIDAIDWSYPS